MWFCITHIITLRGVYQFIFTQIVLICFITIFFQQFLLAETRNQIITYAILFYEERNQEKAMPKTKYKKRPDGRYLKQIIVGIKDDGSYAVKNIYDMAGNVFEWTMEACNTDKRINRGGACSRDNVNYPASNRMQDDPTRVFLDLGFRIALYL